MYIRYISQLWFLATWCKRSCRATGALRYSVNHLSIMCTYKVEQKVDLLGVHFKFRPMLRSQFPSFSIIFHHFPSLQSSFLPYEFEEVWSRSRIVLRIVTGQGGESVERAAGKPSWRSLPMPSVAPHVSSAACDVQLQTLPTSTPRGCCSNLRLHAWRNRGAEGRDHWLLEATWSNKKATAATVFSTDIVSARKMTNKVSMDMMQIVN